MLGVAGPNGAGKSTPMRVLAGEEEADGGTLAIGGRAFSARECGRHVAVIHREPRLLPDTTVGVDLLVGREGGRV